MTSEERIISVLEEIEECFLPIKEALADDGFEEYADTMQDGLDRLTNLLYLIRNKEITG